MVIISLKRLELGLVTRVKFLNTGGYHGEAKKAVNDGLVQGRIYTVRDWEIRDMSSFIELDEFRGVVYSVAMFEQANEVKEIKPYDKVILHEVQWHKVDKLSAETNRAYERFEKDGVQVGGVYDVLDIVRGELVNGIILKQFPGNLYGQEFFSKVSWDRVSAPAPVDEAAIKKSIAYEMHCAIGKLLETKKLTPEMIDRLQGLYNAYGY